MTASVLKKTNQNTQEVKNERLLISTRQNNVRVFGILCLPLTKRQTDKQVKKQTKRRKKEKETNT